MRLTAEKVSKHIGKKQILNEVSLEMESGHVYGFVGRNGSGKTMLSAPLTRRAGRSFRRFMRTSRISPTASRYVPSIRASVISIRGGN